MEIVKNQKRCTPHSNRIAIGYMMWRDGCLPVIDQQNAIKDASRIKFRHDGEIVWTQDMTQRGAADGHICAASQLSTLIAAIQCCEVRYLIIYSCEDVCSEPDAWQKLVDDYIVPMKIRVLAIRERLNNTKDLLRYIDAMRRDRADAPNWIRVHKSSEHPRCPLTPRQHQAITLRGQGLSYHKIAQQMQLSDKHVASLLHDARMRLAYRNVKSEEQNTAE